MGHHCVSPEMEHILCVQKRSCPLRGLRELKWAISIQKQIKAYLAYAEIMPSVLVKNSHVACNIIKFVYYIIYRSQSHKVMSEYLAVMPCCQDMCLRICAK